MNTNSNKYSKTEILQLLLKYSPFWAIYFRVNPLPEDIFDKSKNIGLESLDKFINYFKIENTKDLEKIASLMSMLFGKESVPKKPYK
jgi:hypothetical protein